MYLVPHAIRNAQPSEPTHEHPVARAKLAYGKHAHAMGCKHRQQSTVLELPDDPGRKPWASSHRSSLGRRAEWPVGKQHR